MPLLQLVLCARRFGTVALADTEAFGHGATATQPALDGFECGDWPTASPPASSAIAAVGAGAVISHSRTRSPADQKHEPMWRRTGTFRAILRIGEVNGNTLYKLRQRPHYGYVKSLGGACLLVAVAVATAACGAQGRAAPDRSSVGAAPAVGGYPAGQTAATHVQPSKLSATRDYPGANTQLDPPGTAVATVSASAVLASCGSPQVQCETGDPAKVELALLTNPGMQYDRVLVWALTWTHQSCGPVLGPARPSNAPTPVYDVNTACEFVSFVNASNGDSLYAIRGGFSQ